MLERTNAPRTDSVSLTFAVPSALVMEVRNFMSQKGIAEEQDCYTIDEIFPYTEAEKPLVYLRGCRTREGLTQVQLADKTGIPARHISEMENGKRPIGKQSARKLAEALNLDPRLLLSV